MSPLHFRQHHHHHRRIEFSLPPILDHRTIDCIWNLSKIVAPNRKRYKLLDTCSDLYHISTIRLMWMVAKCCHNVCILCGGDSVPWKCLRGIVSSVRRLINHYIEGWSNKRHMVYVTKCGTICSRESLWKTAMLPDLKMPDLQRRTVNIHNFKSLVGSRTVSLLDAYLRPNILTFLIAHHK